MELGGGAGAGVRGARAAWLRAWRMRLAAWLMALAVSPSRAIGSGSSPGEAPWRSLAAIQARTTTSLVRGSSPLTGAAISVSTSATSLLVSAAATRSARWAR